MKASAKVAYLFMQTLMRSPNIAKNDPYFRFGLIEQDKDDNKFVDCAIVAGADYIVSEDSHSRTLKSIPFPKVNVLLLDEFMKDIFPENE